MNTSSPEEIRRKVRQHLQQMPPAQRGESTTLAITHFTQTDEFKRCKHIGLYFPVRHELDISPLMDICWSDSKQVYLPCLHPEPAQTLFFLPYDRKDELSLNRFSIPEPDHANKKQTTLSKLDVVVTPLLAFGDQGERLGTGGGYYDRTFAYRQKTTMPDGPRLWAIALEAQKYPLQSNPWDVPIDGVSTEQDNYRFDSLP